MQNGEKVWECVFKAVEVLESVLKAVEVSESVPKADSVSKTEKTCQKLRVYA